MNCLIIYNPYSKSRKAVKRLDYIKNRLKTKYSVIDEFCTCGVKSITTYVYDNCNNYSLIVVCGGDGTVNEAINGLVSANSKTTLSIIPSGTCNDLAKMLGISKNVKKAVNNILYGHDVLMDVNKINDKYFTYASAIGKYTNVSYDAKRKNKRLFGRLAYFLEGLREFPKYTKLDLNIKADDYEINGRYYVLFALNSDLVAGFRIKRSLGVKLNDGIIDLTLIKKNENSLTWPRLAKFFLRGDKQKKGVETYHVSHIIVDSNEDFNVNTDGELALTNNHIEIDVIKEALRIRISDETIDKFF